MTVVATCLFVFAALVSGCVLSSSVGRYRKALHSLRRELRDCPQSLEVRWSIQEQPLFADIRTVKTARPLRLLPQAPFSELELAA